MGGESLQQPGVTPEQALRQALDALQGGRHDPRIPEGAQANALESIAWSLIGILAQGKSAAPAASEAALSMSEELRKAGFLQMGQR